MKYLQLFEELNVGKPKIGDWVLCQDSTTIDEASELLDFINNNIGT